jgi:hypothetical protein
MKLEASDVGRAFMVNDFELLKQRADQSFGDLSGPGRNYHSYTIKEAEDFLTSLKRLFPDASYSRTDLLKNAAAESEVGYAEALQHTFDLIDKKNSGLDLDLYSYRSFAILFAVAYKFAIHEDGDVYNKPGFFFVMRVAENVNSGGGSYTGYVGRMINYISSQILEHQELLKSQAEINQYKSKPIAGMKM